MPAAVAGNWSDTAFGRSASAHLPNRQPMHPLLETIVIMDAITMLGRTFIACSRWLGGSPGWSVHAGQPCRHRWVGLHPALGRLPPHKPMARTRRPCSRLRRCALSPPRARFHPLPSILLLATGCGSDASLGAAKQCGLEGDDPGACSDRADNDVDGLFDYDNPD